MLHPLKKFLPTPRIIQFIYSVWPHMLHRERKSNRSKWMTISFYNRLLERMTKRWNAQPVWPDRPSADWPSYPIGPRPKKPRPTPVRLWFELLVFERLSSCLSFEAAKAVTALLARTRRAPRIDKAYNSETWRPEWLTEVAEFSAVFRRLNCDRVTFQGGKLRKIGLTLKPRIVVVLRNENANRGSL